HRFCIPVFEEFFRRIVEGGYAHLVKTFNGSFRTRFIKGTKSLSTHAYGCAIDINAEWGRRGHIFPHQQDRYPRRKVIDEGLLIFGVIWETMGGIWGGRFNPTDAMHFQWAE
ncbi:hypothetical protein LCGC14_3152280, partial [marine sediment metagenome]